MEPICGAMEPNCGTMEPNCGTMEPNCGTMVMCQWQCANGNGNTIHKLLRSLSDTKQQQTAT